MWGADSAAAQQRSKALQVAAAAASPRGGPRPLSRCSKEAATAVASGACRIGFGAGSDIEARGNGGGTGGSGGGASLGKGSSRAGLSGGGRGGSNGQVPMTLPSLARSSGGSGIARLDGAAGGAKMIRSSFEGGAPYVGPGLLLSSFEEGCALQAEGRDGGGDSRLRPSLELQRHSGAKGAAIAGGGGCQQRVSIDYASTKERDAPSFSRPSGGYGSSRLSLDSSHQSAPYDASARGGRVNQYPAIAVHDGSARAGRLGQLPQGGGASSLYASAGAASASAASKAAADASCSVAPSAAAASAPAPPPLVKAGLLARLFK